MLSIFFNLHIGGSNCYIADLDAADKADMELGQIDSFVGKISER